MRTAALLAAVVCIVVIIAGESAGAAPYLERFRTPNDVAYCRLTDTPEPLQVTCFSPQTGDWVRVTLDAQLDGPPLVTQGRDSTAYLGFHDGAWPLIRSGSQWSRPGDTNLVNCKPTAVSMTCIWAGGLVVKINRTAIRVFATTSTPPPVVVPYFRTDAAVRCGLENGGVAGTDANILVCWNPHDGLEMTLAASDTHTASYHHVESDIRFAPAGFPLLRPGTSKNLRRCNGEMPICVGLKGARVTFRCAATGIAMTCRNRANHGFTIRHDGSFRVF